MAPQKIAILGFGREGKAVFKFLKKRNPKLKIEILDRKFDKNYLKNLEKFKIVFRSPGVPYSLPEIQRAIKRGVLFSSATDLFFKNAKGKIIGVTGTKGKGTTSTLLYKILKNAGKDIYLVGNIGKPAISILSKLKKRSWTVLELSSFQLQNLKVSPPYAAVLGIFPDHLDAHKNFKEYLDAKANIARYQKRKDKIFYVQNSKNAKYIAKQSRGKRIAVSPKSFRLFGEKDLKIPGRHNFHNAVMAATISLNLGIPKAIIIKTARNYRGLPYRIQLIKSWKGRKIYNDSASTNPQTTVAAIKSFPQPKIVIMGGYDKNLDYKPVAQALKNSTTKLVILFGENKKKILKTVRNSGVKIKIAPNNLKSVLALAIKNSRVGDIILFSPGAASFDMFKDYKDRGKKFNLIVKKLKS